MVLCSGMVLAGWQKWWHMAIMKLTWSLGKGGVLGPPTCAVAIVAAQGVLSSAAELWPHIHISDSLVMADRAVSMAEAGCT